MLRFFSKYLTITGKEEIICYTKESAKGGPLYGSSAADFVIDIV